MTTTYATEGQLSPTASADAVTSSRNPTAAFFPVLVQQVTLEAAGVISLRLVDPDGGELPHWRPGAHVDVLLPSGLVRQYSLCGDPSDRHSYRVAVLKEPDGRGGSVELHECARVGAELQIRQPRNHFALESARDLLFVAGGIGITPLLPMIREAHDLSIPWRLFYAGRSEGSMAFLAEVRSLDESRVQTFPADRGPRLSLDSVLSRITPETNVYCCGPTRLIDEVTQRCRSALPADALHVERFTAAQPAPAAPEEQREDSAPKEFDVELKRSGCVVRVLEGQTVLDAVRDLAPDVMTSCEEGFCGTCETAVVDGVPEHHDTILSEKERRKNRSMMICVGRSKSCRLVLDL